MEVALRVLGEQRELFHILFRRLAMAKMSCLLLPVSAAFVLALPGCAKDEVKPPPHTHHEGLEVTLCGLCGDIKEDGHVCKQGAKICPYCGLHKGSILCCSPAFTGAHRDVVLCSKCGEVAFSRKCCFAGVNNDAALCPKCGLHKGSPGCCKIPKATGDGGETVVHAHEGGHAG
jgi:hypothetical protein